VANYCSKQVKQLALEFPLVMCAFRQEMLREALGGLFYYQLGSLEEQGEMEAAWSFYQETPLRLKRLEVN
jgi:hypothetical protein